MSDPKRNSDRILIFSGGALGPWALNEIRETDLLVGADRGALFLLRNNLQPDFALGDFDSVNEEELAEIQQGSKGFLSCDPVLKDQTDTELALDWAITRKPAEIVLLGVMGCRFDHTLSNVHLLLRALNQGFTCRIVDESNEVFLIDHELTLFKGRFSNVSLLPLSMEVTGVTLEGFDYPLHRATLRMGDSLAVSNILRAETGRICIASGLLLVICSND